MNKEALEDLAEYKRVEKKLETLTKILCKKWDIKNQMQIEAELHSKGLYPDE